MVQVNVDVDAGFQGGSSGFFTTTPAGPAIGFAIALDGTGTTLASDFVRMYIATGSTPPFTNVVQVLTWAGGGSVPELVTSSWLLSQPLPGLGRPFDRALDRFQWDFRFSPNAPAVNDYDFTIQACGTDTGSSDCCAETLAKLDQLIGYVSKVFPPLT